MKLYLCKNTHIGCILVFEESYYHKKMSKYKYVNGMLKNEIGVTAGVIWQLLNMKKELSINELIELTNKEECIVFLALGWLSRENKITLRDVDDEMIINLVYNESFY